MNRAEKTYGIPLYISTFMKRESRREVRELKVQKKIFKEIMGENIPNLMRNSLYKQKSKVG